MNSHPLPLVVINAAEMKRDLTFLWEKHFSKRLSMNNNSSAVGIKLDILLSTEQD